MLYAIQGVPLAAEDWVTMKTPITVRIDAELLFEVRRCASMQNRIVTNFIETMLRERIAKTDLALLATPGVGPIRDSKRIKDKTAHVV